MHARKDLGESLVEIVFTVVIVGVAVAGLVSGLATAASAGAVQRSAAIADTVLRNAAEATKAAARTCTAGGTYSIDYTPPAGYQLRVTPSDGRCPDPTTTSLLTLSVTGPSGVDQSLQIRIRTP
jgi:type II secretory pathway pseudopilin PulG